MIKTSQKTVTILFLLLLLICSTYQCLTPIANAKDTETPEQQGLAITNNVLKINTADFAVSSEVYPATDKNAFLGLIPQETVIYNLKSDQSNKKILFSFANGDLQLIQMLEDSSPIQQAPLSIATQLNIISAKAFINSYVSYKGDTLYPDLKATLNSVTGKENQTVVEGNITLDVTSSDGSTNFKWYYSANEASAPYTKFIALGIKNGQLSAFVDNWNIYKIGSETVNISKQEAIALAIETARAYANNMGLKEYGFEDKNVNETNIQWTSLLLDTSIDAELARSSDLLELYPDWRIGVQLDKWYGELYGIEVDIWADTGQIRSIQTAYSPITPEVTEALTQATDYTTTAASSNLNLYMALICSVSIVSLTLAGAMILRVNSTKGLKRGYLLKISRRTGSLLLCTILVLSIFLIGTGTANATTRGAAVWGSTSAGAYDTNYPPQNNWRKSASEISYQDYTAGYIATYFSQNGYTGNSGIDHQGTSSTTGQICSDIINLQSNTDYMAVVDFDHGVGGYPGRVNLPAPYDEVHYMFEDNTGTVIGTSANHYTDWNHAIYDMEIYQWVSQGTVVFSFINTCLSADTTQFGQGMLPAQWPQIPPRAIGMPFAWTHRLVEPLLTQGFTVTQHISDDGYNNPDWAPQVYIGFPYGSASLSQGIPFNGQGGNPYYYWVVSFMYHAISTSETVNQALDSASWQFMGNSFGNCPLRTGFTASWWNFPDQPGCTMAVYGNGNIRLQQFAPPADVASVPSISGPTSGNHGNQIGPFTAFSTNPYGQSIQYNFDWGDGTTSQVWCSDGQSATNIYHSWSSGGIYNVRVQARTASSGWSSWSNSMSVNIDNQPVSISVNAYDGYGFDLNPNIYINGNWVATSPATVQVPQGSTLSVDSSTWDPYLGYYPNLAYVDSDGVSYYTAYYY